MTGLQSSLFAESNREVETGVRFALLNPRMLRVSLGPDVLAAKGAMVACQGQVTFNHEGSGTVGNSSRRC